MGTKTVTLAWLREHRACADQVAIFKEEWGESADITRPNLERAAALGLDLYWLAERCLTAPALAEYQRLTAPALADALVLEARL